jgi:hypothetical protein
MTIYNEKLPFSRRSGLADPEMGWRIFCATEGITGYVMKLVRRAAEISIDEKRECLDLEVLSWGYDERLSARAPDRVNPFACSPDDLRLVTTAIRSLGLSLSSLPIPGQLVLAPLGDLDGADECDSNHGARESNRKPRHGAAQQG